MKYKVGDVVKFEKTYLEVLGYNYCSEGPTYEVKCIAADPTHLWEKGFVSFIRKVLLEDNFIKE